MAAAVSISYDFHALLQARTCKWQRHAFAKPAYGNKLAAAEVAGKLDRTSVAEVWAA